MSERGRIHITGYRSMSPGMAQLVQASKARTCQQLGNKQGNILAPGTGGPIGSDCNLGSQSCQPRSAPRPNNSIAHGHSAM